MMLIILMHAKFSALYEYSRVSLGFFPMLFSRIPGPLSGLCCYCYYQFIHLQSAKKFSYKQCRKRSSYSRLDLYIHILYLHFLSAGFLLF